MWDTVETDSNQLHQYPGSASNIAELCRVTVTEVTGHFTVSHGLIDHKDLEHLMG